MGAVQVATIMATPIPKYAKGTDNHTGGPAIVGDGGKKEIVVYSGKAWITPDVPTLVDFPVEPKYSPMPAYTICPPLTFSISASNTLEKQRTILWSTTITPP